MSAQQRMWHSFGSVENEGFALAGTLIYQPSYHLRPGVVRLFQQVLADKCTFAEPGKHPKIEADWYLIRLGDDDKYHYSRIVLFSDGTDEPAMNEHWENCGVLFYRQDSLRLPEQVHDLHEMVHRIHVPDQEGQDELLSTYDFLRELAGGRSEQLAAIQCYLTAVLDDPSAWITRNDLADLE